MDNVLGVYVTYEKIFWGVIDFDKNSINEMHIKKIYKSKIKRKFNLSKELRKQKFKKFLDEEMLGDINDFQQCSQEELYRLRFESLYRLLTNVELGKVLFALLTTRGIKSENKNRIWLNKFNYNTYGEYIYLNGKWDEKKNIERKWVENEINSIYDKQVEFGNVITNEKNKNKFLKIFYYDFSDTDKTNTSLKSKDDKKINDPIVEVIVKEVISIIDNNLKKYNNLLGINLYIESDCYKNDKFQGSISEDERKELEKYYYGTYKKQPTPDELLILKLYKEQKGVSLYSGENMILSKLFEKGYVEIDHIVPKSRNGDNSYYNKVLVLWDDNRKKSNCTPFEYLNDKEWEIFKSRVISLDLPCKKTETLLSKESNFQERIKINKIQKGIIISNIKKELNELIDKEEMKKVFILKNDRYFQECLSIFKIKYSERDIIDQNILRLTFLCGIYDTIIKNLRGKNNEDAFTNELCQKIKISLWPNFIKTLDDFTEKIVCSEGERILKIKLKDLNEENINNIITENLNSQLYKYILLRMEQYNYNGTKAFKDEVFVPSRKGNGNIITYIKIKI